MIVLNDSQRLVVPIDSAWEIIKTELEGMHEGETLTLSKKEMTRETFDNLKEFEGF